MIVLDGKKYACEACIKGHRSSACKHTDRPLFEIKKKGRPVTQCEHCRELRKTQQVHVKCQCSDKEKGKERETYPSARPGSVNASSAGSTPEPPARAGTEPRKRGGMKPLLSPAFPNGISAEALEASTALQILSEGSDSDVSSPAAPPRTSRRASMKSDKDSSRLAGLLPLSAGPSTSASPGTKPQFRPVLPRLAPAGSPPLLQPPQRGPVLPPLDPRGPLDPTHGLVPHGQGRPHAHARGALLYSPYEHAYQQPQPQPGPPGANYSVLDPDLNLDLLPPPVPGTMPWDLPPGAGDEYDYAMASLSIDEWLQQVSVSSQQQPHQQAPALPMPMPMQMQMQMQMSMPPPGPRPPQGLGANPYAFAPGQYDQGAYPQGQPYLAAPSPASASGWSTPGSAPGSAPPSALGIACCFGPCRCPPGQCACTEGRCECARAADTAGGGTGGAAGGGSGGRERLTFAVSGERGPCCSGRRPQSGGGYGGGPQGFFMGAGGGPASAGPSSAGPPASRQPSGSSRR